MQKITHPITHQYQPTSTTCSPTALSMLLAHYDKPYSVDEISSSVPQVKNAKGEDSGTINIQMATWCLSLGFEVDLYSADVQIIDQSWSELDSDELIGRLEQRKDGWIVPSLGKDWQNAYCQAYIDFIKSGGNLHIVPAITRKLLYRLLENGPILVCASFSTMYAAKREVVVNEHDLLPDDIKGRALNHSIVVYGNDADGNFLVADPIKRPGLHVMEPDVLVAAISAAQIECDNIIFQLR